MLIGWSASFTYLSMQEFWEEHRKVSRSEARASILGLDSAKEARSTDWPPTAPEEARICERGPHWSATTRRGKGRAPPARGPDADIRHLFLNNPTEDAMAWTTPTIVEVCAGFEVTAYASAE